MLRDELRAVLRATVVPWSTRRDIDHAVGTIWFPFFEQLYRQTITGGRDVLRVLADMEQVRILPFDVHAEASADGSVVVEGFPGWTLKQCGLPATGCKHVREGGADDRELPARERDSGFRRRCGPGRGRCRGEDAVDALVLLLAAHKTSRRTESEWRDGARTHRCMEGWFFD